MQTVIFYNVSLFILLGIDCIDCEYHLLRIFVIRTKTHILYTTHGCPRVVRAYGNVNTYALLFVSFKSDNNVQQKYYDFRRVLRSQCMSITAVTTFSNLSDKYGNHLIVSVG